jgi:hypothetical protein
MNPVIVDLLSLSATQFYPLGVPVIGGFGQEARHLTLPLTEVRAHAIVQEICDLNIDKPEPLSFFIPICWQTFAIVAAVSGYFDVKPRVVIQDNYGDMMDLVELYNGSMFQRHPVRKVVMPNSLIVTVNGQTAPVSNVPNQSHDL